MDSIYKILESLDKVSENKESGVKITNIEWKDPGAKLPSSLKLNITAPSGSSNEQIYDRIHNELKDEYGEANDFDFQFEESLEEGQYDGKSREELLKMKAKAEADIKNMQSSGDGPQQKFYDETQMMMAQKYLDDIDQALAKMGESVEEAEITPIDHSGDDEGASVEDIASAITRRMMAHPKFGALVREVDIIDLNDAIEDVAQFHEGGDLGTSDVSAMVKDVLKQLGQLDALKEEEVDEAVSLDQARKYFFDKHDFADENIQGEYEKMASKMSSKDAMTLKKELEEFYPDALNEEDVEENAFVKARLDAIKAGEDTFTVGGKTHKVTGDTSDEKAMSEDYSKDEYDEEGEMADNQLDTVADAAKELQDIIDKDDNLPEWVQSKITKAMDYLDTARDYMKSVEDDMEEEPEELEERKLSSSEEQEMERIVTAMKDDPETVKDMKERYGKRWKEVAYATATKMAKQHGKGTGKKKKKTESTVAGAVATGADATGSSIYGNPSIYESFNSQVENMITEGINVTVTASDEGEPTVNVSASGDDAMALSQLLQLAAVPQKPQTMKVCKHCGDEMGKPQHMDCPYDSMDPHGENWMETACEADEANSADNTQTYDMKYLLNTISGGLNGPKRQINPNNAGDNPLAMTGLGKNTLNLEESDGVESHLQKLYKEFKDK